MLSVGKLHEEIQTEIAQELELVSFYCRSEKDAAFILLYLFLKWLITFLKVGKFTKIYL